MNTVVKARNALGLAVRNNDAKAAEAARSQMEAAKLTRAVTAALPLLLPADRASIGALLKGST